ncbi:MAG TPA: DUF5658 family protein [Stellaceae bacterium]|nr:DUF5658 family protein [Stellaceae bacterium]
MVLALAALIAAQVADIVTTNMALAQPGVIEANPLMALFQHDLGLWWLPKAFVAAAVAGFAIYFGRTRWLVIYAAISAIGPLINVL